jgi:SAM-dependent methyltransferase
MKQEIMYKGLAKYYDLIYNRRNYKKEADKIKKSISKYKTSGGKELLEIGCGTGRHLKFFENKFRCTGIDINKEMLDAARKNVKKSYLRCGDMVNFKLNKKFDIILCLFSSIGYVRTYSNLRKTIRNFSRHLKKGGVGIIEPWFEKSEYKSGIPWMSTYDEKDIKIARVNVSKVKSGLSILDFHFLIAEKNKDVRYFVDRHSLGLFDVKKTLKIMKESGLRSVFLKNGLMNDRGLYIAVKN